MKHFATSKFWELFAVLPTHVQEQAYKNFEILKQDVTHPSLHFKKVGSLRSVRINLNYRALAVEEEGDLVWFWVGNHRAYERLIKG